MTPLYALKQFVVVRLEPLPGGKTNKIPLSPMGVNANAHDPANWLSHADAMARVSAWGPSFGVGFVLTEADDFWCLDIDNCRMPDGSWSQLAQQLVGMLPGCAVEISQSGNGLHIWGRGRLPPHAKKNVSIHCELYSEARFILLGTHVHGTIDPAGSPGIGNVITSLFPPRTAAAAIPDTGPRADWRGPADDDELIRRALASRSMAALFGGKATFSDLWNGAADALARAYPSDTGPWDGSSADMALAVHLAWWTGCDVARIERLMRRSALVRAKWDERDDYLVDRTIMTACSMTVRVYQESPPTAPAAPTATLAPTGGIVVAGAPAGPAVARPNPFNAKAAHSQYWPPLEIAEVSPTPTAQALDQALDEWGLQVMRDSFSGATYVREPSTGNMVKLTATKRTLLRMALQRCKFKQIKAGELDAVLEVKGEDGEFDAAQQWLEAQQWDGVRRVDDFCSRYWGVEPGAYAQAVGRYIWSGLAARVLSPGCKADMMVILVGDQGVKKSTSIEALAPAPEFFCELDMDKDEDDLGRTMQGRLVCEMPELRGMGRKDNRAMKSFVARAVDSWVEKYEKEARKYPRRSLIFGSTNEDTFLNDDTGERRYLPLRVAQCDLEAIKRDVAQLWAEGAALYRAGGVAWQDAQRLAALEHSQFKYVDPAQELVANWLKDKTGPVKASDVAFGAFGVPLARVQRSDEMRVAAILKAMGYEKRRGTSGAKETRWHGPTSVGKVG